MKLFGTVESFDEIKGQGLIKPEETGKPAIRFEKSAIASENKTPPPVGKRLIRCACLFSGAMQPVLPASFNVRSEVMRSRSANPNVRNGWKTDIRSCQMQARWGVGTRRVVGK
jgi:cold shock CspA family protein